MWINILAFAGDVALIAHNKNYLKAWEASKVGLQVNEGKIKYMKIVIEAEPVNPSLGVMGYKIAVPERFEYAGYNYSK